MRSIVEKEGFAFRFDQNACTSCNGACCRGESGYIWVNSKEIAQISDFLGMKSEQFKKEYLIKVGYRYSLKELKINGEHFCIFFEEGKGCTIYPVRPMQCRTYPFWDRYKEKKNLQEVCQECKGILLHS
ncbi:YkgJ family cysteine cluster protein [Nitratiruptor sp. SB155-2]|uniref:YkgJ family cysteine cluster protein n=1 Tax=Nitratiruptor sp. (strain SB155-2) TaxID=387092 RepID=UPI0001587266|nr:YkgJ family cysteine cluster protein [Nitratiruptor sp. SB155-2]BAF70101.1 conserved hypothetical protein [Nitratiruptor sp. SB155-2]